MIWLVDAANFETVGYNYSDDERAAALFSLALHQTFAHHEAAETPGEELYQVDDIIDEVTAELTEGPRWVRPVVHNIVTQVLPTTIRVYQVEPRKMPGLCDRLGVQPYDLASNAITAARMQDAVDVELQLTTFDTDSEH